MDKKLLPGRGKMQMDVMHSWLIQKNSAALCYEPRLLLKQGYFWISSWAYGMGASAATAWIYFSSC